MSEDRSVLSRASRAPDRVLHYGPDADHLVDVRVASPRPAKARPLVMLVHGGFWRPQYDRSHTGPLAAAVAGAGWTVATIEYRRVPGVPDASVQDVRLAIEEVPALISDHSGKVLLLGHSAGGHLVLWAASCCAELGLQAVVALAPVADLRLAHELALGEHAVQAFLGVEPQLRPDLDPACLTAPKVPTVILHGQLDAIVPVAVAQAYQIQHPQTRLVHLAGAGHFAVIDPLAAAWHELLATLEQLSGD